jgi:hypothetical protein
VKTGWIEIRSVRSHQGFRLFVQPYLIEHGGLGERPQHLSDEDPSKIDYLPRAVYDKRSRAGTP